MRLDDVLDLLGRNRDYVILALAVLVLVEGGIIVLWARRSSRLRSELQRVAADADAARTAAETAAVAAKSAGAYRAGQARPQREVYSVGGRAAALAASEPAAPAGSTWRTPSAPVPVLPEAPAAPARPEPATAAKPAPGVERPAAPAWSRVADAATATPTAASTATPAWSPPATPEPAADHTAAPAWSPMAATPAPAPEPVAPVEHAEPPAEYVSPVVEQAAAWVLPEVEASHAAPAPETAAAPQPAAGNGWFPAAATPTNGNGNGNGAHPDPTTLGWSGTPVPVEPAADFAVLSQASDVPAARPWDTPAAPESPTLKVLDGAETWTIPAPAIAHPSTPSSFDPAMFDTNDDVFLDDMPTTGDVLLVEDDVSIAKLYRILLESRGYTVRHACDGVEGLDKSNEKRPDLVLLDIMMPRMNGIAFLQALRAGPMRDVPVVVLSNFMEKQLVDDAMSLGALEYMVKAQTRPEALVGALPHWLRGERAFTY